MAPRLHRAVQAAKRPYSDAVLITGENLMKHAFVGGKIKLCQCG
jgi:hypothetical protein